jgi:hypothetical protein
LYFAFFERPRAPWHRRGGRMNQKVDGSHFVASNLIYFPKRAPPFKQHFRWTSQSPIKGIHDNFSRSSIFSASESGMVIATF